MKKIFLILTLLVTYLGFGQEIKKPAEGKAIVYFTRHSSLGFLINFKYFDGDKFLGKFNHGKYLIYECEPGKHLFWVKAENYDFVEADLEAGKTYIIDAEPKMGAFKAAVNLSPLDRNHKKFEKLKDKIFKSIVKGKEYTTTDEEKNEGNSEAVQLYPIALEKYNSKKEKEGSVLTLSSDMNIE